MYLIFVVYYCAESPAGGWDTDFRFGSLGGEGHRLRFTFHKI